MLIPQVGIGLLPAWIYKNRITNFKAVGNFPTAFCRVDIIRPRELYFCFTICNLFALNNQP